MNKRKRDTTRAELIEVMETVHAMENEDMVEYVMRFFSQPQEFIDVTDFKHFLFTKERVIMYQTIQKAKMFDMISEDKVKATLEDMKTLAEEAFEISQLKVLQEILTTMAQKNAGNVDYPPYVVLHYIQHRRFGSGPVTFEELSRLQEYPDEDYMEAYSKVIASEFIGFD